MNRNLINFVAFQAGWFSCVLAAAHGLPLAGLLVALCAVLLHLGLAAQPRAELRLVTIAVLIGLAFDSLLASQGWVKYPNGMLVDGMAPYWILAMWAMFATTLNASMGWMRGRPALAAMMGAVFGPLSYQAGGRLGGLSFGDEVAAMLALGIGWAIVMPVLVALAARPERAPAAPAHHLGRAAGEESA